MAVMVVVVETGRISASLDFGEVEAGKARPRR
jgi:hypothetical protein